MESRRVPLPESAQRFFAGKPVAFMTTMRPDGRMSTNPVAVVFDGHDVLISTTKDRFKYRNLVADDRCTVCVVQPDNLNRYVEIRGRVVLEDDPDRGFINSIAQQYMGVDRYPFDRSWQQRVTVRLIPEAVSSPDIPLADSPPYSKES